MMDSCMLNKGWTGIVIDAALMKCYPPPAPRSRAIECAGCTVWKHSKTKQKRSIGFCLTSNIYEFLGTIYFGSTISERMNSRIGAYSSFIYHFLNENKTIFASCTMVFQLKFTQAQFWRRFSLLARWPLHFSFSEKILHMSASTNCVLTLLFAHY